MSKASSQNTSTDLIRRITWSGTQDAELKKRVEALPKLRSGDNVDVHVKVKEGEKERVQIYTGVVIKVQGSGVGRSFTVRKMSSGIGVERTFPMGSPALEKVVVNSHGIVRRSRLFFLRNLSGRSARLNTKRVDEQKKS
ncbi:MAG TPA: 50S ribosomal protein L19 [Bdellovibrionales bacterium]|nr:50S ribosomal protein L19 [Pseudobdellovibrionaceae bacterium]HAG91755.1 50S ribosomal protein L19 [Bdellovibrionales bacterium]|tara:strand:- start:610 stop:1026 length:417 start_codon:yes stop_codon:yes gene_type:complete